MSKAMKVWEILLFWNLKYLMLLLGFFWNLKIKDGRRGDTQVQQDSISAELVLPPVRERPATTKDPSSPLTGRDVDGWGKPPRVGEISSRNGESLPSTGSIRTNSVLARTHRCVLKNAVSTAHRDV